MTIGDTVFVRWYGKIVEGMIVENNEVTPLLASMVVVRIPVQGVKSQALFMPHHVYPTAELAAMKEGVKMAHIVVPTETPTSQVGISDAKKRLQEFKEANWDHEHNHIKLTALNEFYEMWRLMSASILKIEPKKMSNMDAEKFAEAFSKHTGVITVEPAPKPKPIEHRKPKKQVNVTQLNLF